MELCDSDKNILWELRFEACEDSDDCVHEPGMYHHDTCPRNEIHH